MALEAAIALHQAGRLDEAAAAYHALLAVGGSARPELLQLLALLKIQQGDLRGALEAYDAVAEGGGDAAVHQARGDCLHALDRPAEALDAYAAALALEPRAAVHANRALALIDLARFDEAVAACDAALALTPDDAAVWANRSAALRATGRLEAALDSAEHALALRPGFADALNADILNTSGLAQAALNGFDAALASYEAALAIAPDHRDALNNSGVALTALGRFDEAHARHTAALTVDPAFAEARYNLGLLALRQDDAAGWRDHEARWRRRGQPGPSFPDDTLWLGDEDVAGATVLLHAEQGLGDTIQFARYAPAVKALGARVALRVQPPLTRLMRALAGVDAVIGEDAPAPPFDRHIPLMSLPLVFGLRAGAPYLQADPHAVAAWRARLPTGRLRVGLAWAGNPAHGNDRYRSLPFPALAPLLRGDVTFVSLQKDVRDTDRAALHASAVLPWPIRARDFADTAALTQALDLVITVDTAVAHLAGALGVPTWLLLPRFPDWRWGQKRDYTPWYASARLFRQVEFGAWDAPLAAAAAALETI